MSRITPGQENARMLARLLNVSEEQAASRLDVRVRIVHSRDQTDFAQELRDQLSHTIHVVTGEHFDFEVVIEAEASGKNVIFVGLTNTAVSVSSSPIVSTTPPVRLHPLQNIIAACFAAGAIFRRVIGGLPHVRATDPFIVRFDVLGATHPLIDSAITVDDTVLVGAGAVANGFLRACRHLKIQGELTVCDPKLVGGGNPNRCLYFDGEDVGKPKAERLCARAQPDLPQLLLNPVNDVLESIVKARRRVRRIIVAVDSRGSRRSLQDQLPLEVVDASTTDASEIIIHSHRQPTQGACLGCIYRHIPDELAREKDIAAGLGVELDDVVEGRLIDERVAKKIIEAHPGLGLTSESLKGVAFDSLFKQLCGEMALITPQGAQVLAPFAFVSNLAGALLALELVRFDARGPLPNYMFLSPWAPPHPLLRSWRGRDPDCHFCRRETSVTAMKHIWPEYL